MAQPEGFGAPHLVDVGRCGTYQFGKPIIYSLHKVSRFSLTPIPLHLALNVGVNRRGHPRASAFRHSFTSRPGPTSNAFSSWYPGTRLGSPVSGTTLVVPRETCLQ